MERTCLEWAEACDLDPARDALITLSANYREAADAIGRDDARQ
jgi:hypothetical protein